MVNRHSSNNELTRWQLRSQILLNVFTVVALIIGGLWAWFEFSSLLSAEKAEAELRKLQIETERLPVIGIKVDAKVIPQKGNEQLIEINILLTNQGKLKEILNLEKDPLRIYPVEFKGCRSCLSPPTKPWLKANLEFPRIIKSTNLLPGASQRFRALYKAPAPGMYFVEFVVELSDKSLEQWKGVRDISNPGEFKWTDSVFIEVPNRATP